MAAAAECARRAVIAAEWRAPLSRPSGAAYRRHLVRGGGGGAAVTGGGAEMTGTAAGAGGSAPSLSACDALPRCDE